MNSLRVAIVGCGKIADQHAEQIRRVSGCRLVATCDREKLMAAQLAERYEVDRVFDHVDQLLKEVRPDVVHLTTPPRSHFELTKKCLNAGCHVYVEKPFSIDLREAQAMVQLAEQLGLKITAGHNIQFSPEMIRMRDRVRQGFLGGRPVHIESTFSYSLGDGSYVKSLLGDQSHWVRALPGKLLQNLISHGVAKVAEFVDSHEIHVSAFGFTSPKLQSMGETEIVDEVRVLISDRQKTTAYFTFTTQIAPPVQELRVFGTKASIVVDNIHRTVIERTPANSDRKSYLNFLVPPAGMARQYAGNLWANAVAFIKADFHMDQGMRNLIDAFYLSIRSGSAPPIPYREILVTASVMDQIFCQLDHRMRPAAAAAIEAQPAAALSGDLS